MFIYKNTSDRDLSVINVGLVQPGKILESLVEVNHPDLELVREESQEPAQEKKSKKDR